MAHAGVMFRRMSQKRSILETDAGASPWADLQPEILGIVLRFLPSLPDRASVRSVCRHWRTGARGHVLPVPLPILVLPESRFSSLSDKGGLMAVWRAPVPSLVGADDVRCVGSVDGWLVGVTPSQDRRDEYYRDSDGECFLVNAFSRKVICLPRMCNMDFNFSAYSRKTLRIVNGSSAVHFCANGAYTMSLRQVVLSAPPESGSKYIVAASSCHKSARVLAIWQPGMMLWQVCSGVEIDGPKDLTFYQGKLYVLLRHRPRLFAFELEDDSGFMVSRVELCLTRLPLEIRFQGAGAISCNMVVWRGELLLIIRLYSDDCYGIKVLRRVKVFALDVGKMPYGLTEIRSFNGDCIFVSSGGCKSFPASPHDGVEGDLIYFVPNDWKPHDIFVYSMRDGRMKPFPVKLFARYFGVPEDNLDFPVWLLPTE